jgi:hypothetical protein
MWDGKERRTDISHSELYLKLGTLEGKLDALIIRSSEYKDSLAEVFTRLQVIENKYSVITGFALLAGIVVPIIVSTIAANFQFNIDAIERSAEVRNK